VSNARPHLFCRERSPFRDYLLLARGGWRSSTFLSSETFRNIVGSSDGFVRDRGPAIAACEGTSISVPREALPTHERISCRSAPRGLNLSHTLPHRRRCTFSNPHLSDTSIFRRSSRFGERSLTPEYMAKYARRCCGPFIRCGCSVAHIALRYRHRVGPDPAPPNKTGGHSSLCRQRQALNKNYPPFERLPPDGRFS